ncbi:3-hydroxyacyl-ACP dehydratase [Flavobacterium aquicola]|uniref:3-hydroxyacyl-[acyl-carrier-protein] dehydratase n=1 Tax=Flavobacterium aquicola TaxID=1682742 RepID=A0A3E0EWN8_9FLAO|nr:3-hydroxyacyl-ACP dehydratase [Flavobacterium aquicola]REH01567.1 3-hydroxyacyl-[acyl-carrier-protein] dehydratase [Flavobacterium aquicola]
MLLKDFYKIISLENTADSKYKAQIIINEKHDVFQGHFPGNPVMPGVCMIQIIKELTEQITTCSLFMESLSNVKFMALINPFVHPDLLLELDIITTYDNMVKVKNVSYFDQTVALKLSCVYKKV